MKKLVLALLFLASLSVTLGAGYRVGRAGLPQPSWMPVQISEVLTSILPSSRQQAPLPPPGNLAGYEFRLLDQKAKQGDTTIPLELVNKTTGKRVPDAIVFARRIDMAPDGMATMTAPLEPEPSGEPGTYRFRTNLAMAGSWQVSVAAKVPGEVGTVQGRLLLKAEP